jgi:hypothetical protein
VWDRSLCCQVDRDDLDSPVPNGVPRQPLIRRVAGRALLGGLSRRFLHRLHQVELGQPTHIHRRQHPRQRHPRRHPGHPEVSASATSPTTEPAAADRPRPTEPPSAGAPSPRPRAAPSSAQTAPSPRPASPRPAASPRPGHSPSTTSSTTGGPAASRSVKSGGASNAAGTGTRPVRSQSATHASGSNIHSSIETAADNFDQTRSAIPARIASGAFLLRRLLAEVTQPTGSRARNTGSRLDRRGMAGLGTYADRKSLWPWAGDAYTGRRPRPSRSRKGWVSWPSLSSACLRPPVLLPGLQPPDPAGPVGTRTRRVNPDPRDRGGQPLIRRVNSSLVFHD